VTRDETADDGEEADHDRTTIGSRADLLAASRRNRAYFIVLAGESLGQMFRVDASGVVIGRSADAGIRLRGEGVSRQHARVTVVEGRVHLEDLASANGMLVNGERVARATLRDGDKVQLGTTTILKFTYTDELEEEFRRRMHDAAVYDALTRACNKAHFLDRLGGEVAYAKRHAAALALIMLDVDHFKRINDAYGHPAGDAVLATLGQVVRATIRTEDLFARYGGEEFAVLCRATSTEAALVLAERLRATIEASACEHHERRIPVTVSIGVAAWFDQPDSASQLVREADEALYEAKKAGRNRVVSAARRA
jgi:diguanylate cyclase (GGDEF)-like protein